MREGRMESKFGKFKQFLKEDRYNAGAFTAAFVSVLPQQVLERSIPNPQLLPELPYNLIYNSGDFAEAFLFGTTTNMVLRAIAPEMSSRARLITAAAVSTGLLVGMETVQFHHPISYLTGTADLGDLPAGILGVGAYALGSIINERVAHGRSVSRKRLDSLRSTH